MASPAQPTHTHPSIEHLIDEYSGWKSVLDRETDDYGAVSKLVTLYRFANYSNPLAELLLDAIVSMEATAPKSTSHTQSGACSGLAQKGTSGE